MTCAIYARVSTTDQHCEVQLTELRRYAEARGWTVFREYVDSGVSGKKTKRPALDRCMEAARERRFDCIVVWKLDRWGRTVAQLAKDVQEFDSIGIRFIAVETGIDTDKSNSMSRFTLHIMAAFAELEREMIQERVVAGIRHAQKHGTRSGNAIGRPRAAVRTERVLAMHKKGLSLREIAEQTGVSAMTAQRILKANAA